MTEAHKTCNHEWAIYRGKTGNPNWCPKCGAIKTETDEIFRYLSQPEVSKRLTKKVRF